MRKNKIFALMAAAISFAACTTNDVADITNSADNNVVNVASATRAADGGTVAMTLPFHLVNTTLPATYDEDFEADFTYNNGSYTTMNGKFVAWNNSKYNNGKRIDNRFVAFTPLKTSDNNASYLSFTLPTDQSTAEKLEAADWMTATTTSKVDDNNGAIDLTFIHKFAKLHFTVTAKDDAANLTSQSFKIFSSITPYYNSADNTIEAIIDIRQTIINYTPLITIVTSDNETLTVAAPSGISFAEGKQYNFNLTMGHYAATITSVSVTDWTSQDINMESSDANNGSETDYVTFYYNNPQGFKFRVYKGNGEGVLGFEYSVNNEENWISIPNTGMTEYVTFGGSYGNLRLRGEETQGTARGESYATVEFSQSTDGHEVTCTGDIRTLVDYRIYKTVRTDHASFKYLFKDCSMLSSAPSLPAIELKEGCYEEMFYGCNSLKQAPVLPATTLAKDCYKGMFVGCNSLTQAPTLPATTLAESCYENMFKDCHNLSKVTIMATKNISGNLNNWLSGAGDEAATRTLTVANQDAYNTIKDNLPREWKIGADNTTVKDKAGNEYTPQP